MNSYRALLLGSVTLAGLIMSTVASAQTAQAPVQSNDGVQMEPVGQDSGDGGEILVTGSRIRQTGVTTSAPVVGIDAQYLENRGYTSAADALNDLTSAVPNLAQATTGTSGTGNGSGSGNGQQPPNLFGLGAGRTLTLINGRRVVASSNGISSSTVDTNIVPLGLLKSVEVVQAGGASVYGSDAVAGVVNYILDDKFDGIKIDVQSGISSRADYATYSARAVAGKNFGGGRGNIAVEVDWSKSPGLGFEDRSLSALGRQLKANPANVNNTDGLPSVISYNNATFYTFNGNGVIFATPAPTTGGLLQQAGSGFQFAPDGSVIPYNIGTFQAVPFSIGGDGTPLAGIASLRTALERFSGNLVGSYELTDNIKFSTELLYSRTEATQMPQGLTKSVLSSAATGAGPIAFNRTNPYLTQAAITSLSALSPSFAAGGNLQLSKIFYDLRPSNLSTTTTKTYRAVAALDGDFDLGGRSMYWSVSGNYGRVEGRQFSYGIDNAKFAKAINSVGTPGGIVCAVNADASTANDDAACQPVNPFGQGNVSAAARNYVSVPVGSDFTNEQKDLLATLGGTAFTLPAGDLGFSLAYEHRDESASFTPFEANLIGLTGSGLPEAKQSGQYNTDEFSGEVRIPLLGKGFNLPGIAALEATGAVRRVDNSIAGKETVWSAGLRWDVISGLTLRGSRSRNFRAPSLSQILAPQSTSLSSGFIDPCDSRNISAGPNPTVRAANCRALFAANPQYGNLATFTNSSQNFPQTLVTTGGNPNLRNEISNTLTFGVVFEPTFIPGLTFTADRIEIDLRDGISAFTPSDFAAACYDNVVQPADICSTFTRRATTDPVTGVAAGTFTTALSTTFNAGITKYRGEVYNLNYRLPLSRLFGGEDLGMLRFGVEATHTALLTESVTGSSFTRQDGTISMPSWTGKIDVNYVNGPLSLSYQLYYLDSALFAPNATIENTPDPFIAGNTTHSISAQYQVGQLRLRAGITNLTDKMPSYPVISYGDILGRRFFVGSTIRF